MGLKDDLAVILVAVFGLTVSFNLFIAYRHQRLAWVEISWLTYYSAWPRLLFCFWDRVSVDQGGSEILLSSQKLWLKMCATAPSSSTLSIGQISVNFSLQLILFQLKFQNLSIDVVSLNKNCKLNIFKLIFFPPHQNSGHSQHLFSNICHVGSETQLNSKGRRDYSGAKWMTITCNMDCGYSKIHVLTSEQ